MRNLPVSTHNSLPAAWNNEPHPYQTLQSRQMKNKPNNSMDYLGIIRNRKLLIFSSLLATVFLVSCFLYFQEPVYKSESLIMIENHNDNFTQSKSNLYKEYYILTEIDIIKDKSTIQKVIDSIDLEKKHLKGGHRINKKNILTQKFTQSVQNFILYIKEHLVKLRSYITSIIGINTYSIENFDSSTLERHKEIDDFQKNLKVRMREGTNLIDITLTGFDQYLTTNKLNTLIGVYIDNNLEKKLHKVKKSIAWIENEVENLEQKILASEKYLEKFRKERKFTNLTESKNQSVLSKNFSDANSNYISLKRRIDIIENQINKFGKNRYFNSEEILNFPIIQENVLLSNLGEKYIKLISEYRYLLKSYKTKHPKILNIVSQIRLTKKSMIGLLNNEKNILYRKKLNIEKELKIGVNTIIQYENNVSDYTNLQRKFEVDKSTYIDMLNELKKLKFIEAKEENNIKLIRQASIPIYPMPTGKLPKILASIIVGLGIGIGFSLLIELFDTRFKNMDEVETDLSMPFLGFIPRHRGHKHAKQQPFLLHSPASAVSDAYEILRTRIQASPYGPIKTLLVTSALAGEGKSTTVVNLGISFAQIGMSVLIVDVDLRHPSLHHHFSLPNSSGLTHVLADGVAWQPLTQNTDQEKLQILPTGIRHSTISGLLTDKNLEQLIQNWKETFDIVIFDAAPVLSLPDVEILAPKMDGVLLVHNPDKEKREPIAEATKILERIDTPILGIVFNNINTKKNNYGYIAFNY